MKRSLGVIPARYRSTRFPGKALASLGDKTLVEQVWRRMRGARRLERVVIATDDERIFETCRAFGAEVMLTSPDHPSGTDRVAEVARKLAGEGDVIVNVQGDEPFVSPASLDRLAEAFDADAPPEMATLVEPLESVEQLFDPNTVKVVAAQNGRALYFSRSPIPYHRGRQVRLAADFREALASRTGHLGGYWKHQGVYAYRFETLQALNRLPPSPLELDEGLEQLRALQAGFDLRVLQSDFRSVTVETPEDLERAAAVLAEVDR